MCACSKEPCSHLILKAGPAWECRLCPADVKPTPSVVRFVGYLPVGPRPALVSRAGMLSCWHEAFPVGLPQPQEGHEAWHGPTCAAGVPVGASDAAAGVVGSGVGAACMATDVAVSVGFGVAASVAA